MSNERALERQNDGSTEASPGGAQMREQFNPSSLSSPHGYDPSRASRDMDAVRASREIYNLGRVPRGSRPDRREYEAPRSMGPPPPRHQGQPQQAGYMPSLLFPGTSYQQGENWDMGEPPQQQQQQQELQHQMQEQHQMYLTRCDASSDAHRQAGHLARR